MNVAKPSPCNLDFLKKKEICNKIFPFQKALSIFGKFSKNFFKKDYESLLY
jgi:hypothetical protein